MISKNLALQLLNLALSTGGDYAELYIEKTTASSLVLENGEVDSCGKNVSLGVGLRILNGVRSVYGYTADASKKGLFSLAKELSAAYQGERKITVSSIHKAKTPVVNHIRRSYAEVKPEEEIAMLKECYAATKAVDPRIVRIQDIFSSSSKEIEIFSAEGEAGKQVHNVEERGRLIMIAVARGEDGDIETAFAGPGTSGDYSFFENLDYKERARKVGENAILLLSAKECPSGRFPVVIANGWGGVLFHESCGHALEASATSKHLSVFSDCIGKQIASPLVSAYDDGTIPNAWGSNSVDSEGHPTQKNMLIKDGICIGYMIDKLNGRRLGMEANGTSRRQNYTYEPTSRMSNTYIAAGKDNPEDIIKDTKLGIYVADFGGGSVEPATGEFNFSASTAYVIRDGKIAEPLKGCTLIGTGKEVLMNIDRVGNDVALGQGMCGAASGSIPVNVGQPTIRVKEISVGGRGGKLE